ncbi:undecaprenyl-diphosphatase [Chromobacterium sp. IIBBL 290-4]|uniref:undecaprenyl-diphosphatase n=1 Tax=Chromobacterium sp. IIBBL 290-4 TaxID=2953890 RepID=UPI0020B6E187|nr:undecaprenyl-diphosphatase [Chromobacterium sp. IIBBL 290-4]UTH76642.1 undecaprenyl-diphosphatase [Chromobacterium sp. IIBBL 290-4]
MDEINYTIFLWLNAPAAPSALAVALAKFSGEYLIFLLPPLLLGYWFWGGAGPRKAVLEALAAALLALTLNQLIGWLWPQPRPFMLGLGHCFLDHAADASFPSDHLTLWWSVAFSFWLGRTMRAQGRALVLLGLPMAWARIYLGVHFPLDMLGAAAAAGFSAWMAYRLAWRYLPPVYCAALAMERQLRNRFSALSRAAKE